jgi:hypothetical protein
MTRDAHVSPLMLDSLALDALDLATAERVQAHLASCAGCREHQGAAAELRREFASRALPRRAERPVRRWWWLALPAVAVVVVIALGAPGGLGRRAEPPRLAIKGDVSWQVFANRGGETFAVRDGSALAAGDQIRFVVLPGGGRYLLVASIDGNGAATIYYPYGGERSAAVDGERVELGGSIVLDDAAGPERIYAILSDEPLAAAAVKAQLRAVAAGGEAAIRRTRTLPVPARAQLSLMFEKAAP